MFLSLILILLAVSIFYFYKLGRYNEAYWKKRGVKFYSENKVTGPFWNFIIKRRAMFEVLGDLYDKYKNEPALGFGAFITPTLFVIDPKNIKHVLSTNFQSFSDRGVESPEGDQLSDNLLFMNGPRWKLVRKNMTPLFTANKLKNMYYIMDRSGQDFVQFLNDNPKLWEGDIFKTLTTFCNAAICAAIFGISTESAFDSPMLKMAKKVSTSNIKSIIKFSIRSLSPEIANVLGVTFFKEYEDFFVGAIRDVIKKREQENIKKHDFADICINLQKNGTMKDATTGCELEPTYGLLSAQAFFFFIAGVEPCASSLISTLTLLSRHADILEKVHEEIDIHFDKYSNNITYEVISEMVYVDKVLSEAMRIFPPIGYLTRKCVQDSLLPVGNIKVDRGTNMFIPIYAIHHDPELYPEPHVFDPERFSKDTAPSDEIYMPFGLGNRMCIGARYAKLQVMAGLVHVLRHFTVQSKAPSEELTFVVDIISVRLKNDIVKLIPRSVK